MAGDSRTAWGTCRIRVCDVQFGSSVSFREPHPLEFGSSQVAEPVVWSEQRRESERSLANGHGRLQRSSTDEWTTEVRCAKPIRAHSAFASLTDRERIAENRRQRRRTSHPRWSANSERGPLHPTHSGTDRVSCECGGPVALLPRSRGSGPDQAREPDLRLLGRGTGGRGGTGAKGSE